MVQREKSVANFRSRVYKLEEGHKVTRYHLYGNTEAAEDKGQATSTEYDLRETTLVPLHHLR